MTPEEKQATAEQYKKDWAGQLVEVDLWGLHCLIALAGTALDVGFQVPEEDLAEMNKVVSACNAAKDLHALEST